MRLQIVLFIKHRRSVKSRTYPRLVRLRRDPRRRTLLALRLVLSAVGVAPLPHSLLVVLGNPTTDVPPDRSGNSICDGLVSPSGIPSPYGRVRRSCSMLPPCTPLHGIVHTFRMGALPGQARPRAVHSGAISHPGSGRSGSASAPPRAPILVLRLSRSVHGHHGSPARCSCSSVLPSFL